MGYKNALSVSRGIINRSKTQCHCCGPHIIIVHHSKQFLWSFPNVFEGVKRQF